MAEAATLELFPEKVPVPFEAWQIELRDAAEYLRELHPQCVDLVVTDIAYESLEKHRAVGTTTRLKKSDGSSNEWFPIFRNERFPELFRELYRVLKKDAHLYFFCDAETMFVAKPIAEVAGFKFWKPIVWDYGRIGMGYHYRARHQFVLFFEKGKRKLKNLGTPDVLNVQSVPRKGSYPTEKPVALLETLISQSSESDQTVLDPFMGSGSAGAAALNLGRRFLGCDVALSSLACARARLDAIAPGGKWALDPNDPEAPHPPGIAPPAFDESKPWPPEGWQQLEEEGLIE